MFLSSRRTATLSFLASLALSSQARAQDETNSKKEPAQDGEITPVELEGFEITARYRPDPSEVPVEAFVVSEEEIERQQPINVSDVLARVPGVQIRPEEGMGLRPNIGFRGLSSDRSRNVLVLEDGIPVQMMPYDYPELYIAPRIERMSTVEVVRGAASILYGPRTIGGVVNFVTLKPPQELLAKTEVRMGTGGYYFGSAIAGDTVGDVGVLLTAMHQRFNGPRDLMLRQTDVMGRLALDLHHAGQLGLKLQFYDENSTSTNLGLTTLQYENGNLDNYAQNDRFPIRRYAAQLTHDVDLSSQARLVTTGYFNVSTRDWWRQDYLRSSAQGADVERIVDPYGNTLPPNATSSNDGSAVYFLNSNVGRLRRYTVGGIEPRMTVKYDWGRVSGEMISGLRVHSEEGEDVDIAGASPTARTGTIQAQQTRHVFAVAVYMRPTFEFFKKRVELAPALRVENIYTSINSDRAITDPGGIENGVYQAPTSTTYNPPLKAHPTTVAVIPGASALWRILPTFQTYAGMHRGFVPPGVRDAIVGNGRDVALQPEWAWNYEWGVRGDPFGWLRYEGAVFYTDYRQQVLPPTAASTTPSGGVQATGSSKNYGFEASTTVDLAQAAEVPFQLPITAAYTFAQAHFKDGWAPGISGKVVPYVPVHTLSGRVDFVHPLGIEAQVSVNYTSAQYSDPYNNIEPSLDGTSGLIKARAVANARLAYNYRPWHATVFAEVRNLTNTQYIASRAPAGIQPGMTRQAFAGLRLEY